MKRITTAVAVSVLLCLSMTSGEAGGSGYTLELCQRDASHPIAASNSAEEVLVAWEQTEGEVHKGSCQRAVTRAAIESPTGAVSLGVLPTGGNLAYPVGSYIDDAGDAWVAGQYGEIGYYKYGPYFEKVGAWLSFRPQGGHFEKAVKLPSRHGRVDSVLIVGNHKGQVLLAWGTPNGTYLGWIRGDVLLDVRYVGKSYVAGMGVTENGHAVIIGYHAGSYGNSAFLINAITAGPMRHFSRARVIARPPRSPRKGFVGHMGLPVVGVGPNGQAVIAFRTAWSPKNEAEELEGPNMFVYWQADGRFDHPKPFAKAFLEASNGGASYPGNGEAPEPPSVVVDRFGRATIFSSNERGVEEVFLTARGTSARRVRLSSGHSYEVDSGIDSVGNPSGQTIAAWITGLITQSHNLTIVLGDTGGHHGNPVRLKLEATETFSGPVSVISSQGVATIVWTEAALHGESVVELRSLAPGATTMSLSGSASVLPH